MDKLLPLPERSTDVLIGPETRTPICAKHSAPTVIGDYALFDQVASGGTGVLHLGRRTTSDFENVVAIKRMHSSVARDAVFVSMFRERMQMLSCVSQQNIVRALDAVEEADELLLVWEYVHGQSLGTLAREARGSRRFIPLHIGVAIACGALEGLHAAHGAHTVAGVPVGIVHGDVSPRRILIGCDGLARMLDFGLAKSERSELGYISPESILGKKLDCRADVYGVSVVLWELLACARLFRGNTDSETFRDIVDGRVPSLADATSRPIPPLLEEVVRRGLAKDPNDRFHSAHDMALALQDTICSASPEDVSDWVIEAAHSNLTERSRQLAWAENCSLSSELLLGAKRRWTVSAGCHGHGSSESSSREVEGDIRDTLSDIEAQQGAELGPALPGKCERKLVVTQGSRQVQDAPLDPSESVTAIRPLPHPGQAHKASGCR